MILSVLCHDSMGVSTFIVSFLKPPQPALLYHTRRPNTHTHTPAPTHTHTHTHTHARARPNTHTSSSECIHAKAVCRVCSTRSIAVCSRRQKAPWFLLQISTGREDLFRSLPSHVMTDGMSRRRERSWCDGRTLYTDLDLGGGRRGCLVVRRRPFAVRFEADVALYFAHRKRKNDTFRRNDYRLCPCVCVCRCVVLALNKKFFFFWQHPPQNKNRALESRKSRR
jgi:hypothetical protein